MTLPTRFLGGPKIIMYYLLFSVVCSVIVSVILKISRRNNIILEQAIAANYAIAFALTLILLQPNFPSDFSTLPLTTFLALGILLPSVFIIMGRAVECAGIAKSDIAQRLSLIIPIILSVFLFDDTLTENKIIGVTLSFIALFCLLVKDNKGSEKKATVSTILLLLSVWLGYGVIGVLFKQLTKLTVAFPTSLAIIFPIGLILMQGYITVLRQKWSIRSLIGGMVLGIFNFGNILFYLKAHAYYSNNAILVFAGMDIGVIVLGTLTGAIIFKEKLNIINIIGLALAITAVGFLFY